MTLLDLYNILLQVGIPVAHNEAELDEYPYIVYQEFNSSYDTASGRAYREKTRVDVTHFSKAEFDPSFDRLKKTLLENNINFTVATTYDKDSKVTHNQIDVVITADMIYRGLSMKVVISQNGQQVFTVGANTLINIAPVELTETDNPPIALVSVGIEGISFGVYKESENAQKTLNELVKFLNGGDSCYTIPADTE